MNPIWDLMGHLLFIASKLAKEKGPRRIQNVNNCGADGDTNCKTISISCSR